MKVVALDGQSLVDISIQVYGSAEGVFILARENGMEVTDVLKPGQVLEYSTGNVIAKSIAQYFTTKKIHPATGVSFNPEESVWEDMFDLTF